MGTLTRWSLICRSSQGLIPAICEELPQAEHRMCARHVLAIWGKKWQGDERRFKFWECAWATFEVKLKDKLAEMDKLGKGTVEDLLNYNKTTWCRAFFNFDCKSDVVHNNMCETFNSWILGPRCKSIITMLEEIRLMVNKRKSREDLSELEGKTRMSLKSTERFQGLQMTCTTCQTIGHNKAVCPRKNAQETLVGDEELGGQYHRLEEEDSRQQEED